MGMRRWKAHLNGKLGGHAISSWKALEMVRDQRQELLDRARLSKADVGRVAWDVQV